MSTIGPRDPRAVALDIARVIGQAVADLATLDRAVESLSGFGPRQRDGQIEGIRAELRRVRDLLRPIDADLWRAARESMAREEREDAERAEKAKDATVRPGEGGPL